MIRRLCLCIVLAFVVCPSSANAKNESKERDICEIKVKQLAEISGIAASRQNPDVLWVHNDGNSGLLFAIRTTGELVAMVSSPVALEDFEDIAIAPNPKTGHDDLYLGDIGNNERRRDEVKIVRFAEPDLANRSAGQVHVESAEVYRLRYPAREQDAEALIVDPQTLDVYVVSKEPDRARLFYCSAKELKAGGIATLKFAGDAKAKAISGATCSPDGSSIILRTEASGWLWRRDPNQAFAATLERPGTKISVRGKRQGQNGEAVSFSTDGRGYYTVSEGKSPMVCLFPVPPITATSVR